MLFSTDMPQRRGQCLRSRGKAQHSRRKITEEEFKPEAGNTGEDNEEEEAKDRK